MNRAEVLLFALMKSENPAAAAQRVLIRVAVLHSWRQ